MSDDRKKDIKVGKEDAEDDGDVEHHVNSTVRWTRREWIGLVVLLLVGASVGGIVTWWMRHNAAIDTAAKLQILCNDRADDILRGLETSLGRFSGMMSLFRAFGANMNAESYRSFAQSVGYRNDSPSTNVLYALAVNGAVERDAFEHNTSYRIVQMPSNFGSRSAVDAVVTKEAAVDADRYAPIVYAFPADPQMLGIDLAPIAINNTTKKQNNNATDDSRNMVRLLRQVTIAHSPADDGFVPIVAEDINPSNGYVKGYLVATLNVTRLLKSSQVLDDTRFIKIAVRDMITGLLLAGEHPPTTVSSRVRTDYVNWRVECTVLDSFHNPSLTLYPYVTGAAIFFALAGIALLIITHIARHRTVREYLVRLKSERASARHAHQIKTNFLSFLWYNNNNNPLFLFFLSCGVDVVSHELRNPLHGIIGISGFTLEQLNVTTFDDLRQNLSSIQISAQGMKVIVDDALDFQRLESGRISFECISFNLHSVITALVHVHQSNAQSKNVLIRIVAQNTGDGIIFGDPHRIRQIICNLLTNSVKFTLRGEIVIGIQLARLGDLQPDQATGPLFRHIHSISTSNPEPPSSHILPPTIISNSRFIRFNKMNSVSLGLSPLSANRDLLSVPFTRIDSPATAATAAVAMSSTEENGGDWILEITVEDTGVGIPADTIPLLFSDFTQGKLSIAREYGGSGLGLSIVKRITTLMGGTVYVRSEVGVGTRFTVRIPVRKSANENNNSSTRHSSIISIITPDTKADLKADAKADTKADTKADDFRSRSGALLRVLLVEDQPINQKVTCMMLAKDEFVVDIAENGLVAVQRSLQALAMAHPYDIILMDINMPVMSGIQATRVLRSCDVRCPIVAITGNALPEEMKACQNAQMDHILVKPFTKTQLITTIRQLTHSQPTTATPITTPTPIPTTTTTTTTTTTATTYITHPNTIHPI